MAAENLSSKGFSSLLLCTKLAKKARGAPLSDPHHGANSEFPLSYHRFSGIQNGRGDLSLCFSLSETMSST